LLLLFSHFSFHHKFLHGIRIKVLSLNFVLIIQLPFQLNILFVGLHLLMREFEPTCER